MPSVQERADELLALSIAQRKRAEEATDRTIAERADMILRAEWTFERSCDYQELADDIASRKAAKTGEMG